jgi:hypothetical protein
MATRVDVSGAPGHRLLVVRPDRHATVTIIGDTGLAARTLHSYRVRPRHAAGNLGAYSAIVSASDIATPGILAGPAAMASSTTQIKSAGPHR